MSQIRNINTDNQQPKHNEEEYVSGEAYHDELEQLTPTATPLGWRQKVGVTVLGLFGISAVVLWGLQFKNSLGYQKPINTSQNTAQQSESAKATRLQKQDTDQDGLSDYNELYIYKTSPYLQDTDSDGVSDFDEVQAGEDPNCPRGSTCTADTPADTPTDTTPIATSTAPAVPVDSGKFTTVPVAGGSDAQSSAAFANTRAMEAILSGKADPTNLRQMLIEAGMSKDVLDKFSDDELLQVYQQTLQNNQQK